MRNPTIWPVTQVLLQESFAHEVKRRGPHGAIKSGNVTIPIYRVENKRYGEAGSSGMIRITNDTKRHLPMKTRLGSMQVALTRRLHEEMLKLGENDSSVIFFPSPPVN